MVGFRRYPAGIQDFEEIREGGFVYVDKTRYIYDHAHTKGNAIFLNRPRPVVKVGDVLNRATRTTRTICEWKTVR